jgi:hypothetical protein
VELRSRVQVAPVGVWWLLRGKFAWAMCAGFIHLCGARCLFATVYQAAQYPFEEAAGEAVQVMVPTPVRWIPR